MSFFTKNSRSINAIAVDGEKIEQLITQIPDSQQHIAQKISDMLAKYDFDAIIDLTES